MSEVSEIRYATSGPVHIAYEVSEDGPLDVVFDKGWAYDVELLWEWPAMATLLRGIGSFGRLILFDHRGTGMSDPVSMDTMASLDQWLKDQGLTGVECSGETGRVSVLAARSSRRSSNGPSNAGCAR